jgi:poly-gamma-glutamate capsule biosynthesis protein CapA/YwtB (metallophosphatase superfamily)
MHRLRPQSTETARCVYGARVQLKLALAGDTMLGRGVAERLRLEPVSSLFAPEVVEAAHEADLFVLNLECCVTSRGSRWPDPRKPFFFRAPPVAVEALALLGVDCVTLANNHALDYGHQGLLDTLDHLSAAGIATVGAGATEVEARQPAILAVGEFQLAVVGVTENPAAYAAALDRPGVAYADLGHDLPAWLLEAVGAADADADAVLVTPHWGPNMAARPQRRIRIAGDALVQAGATLVAGHSAHVFHGVHDHVLYDLGDFVDDYAIDPLLRNDLGLLFFVTLDDRGPLALEAIPLKLDYCHTGLAAGADSAWIRHRFRKACHLLGTEVGEHDGRLAFNYRCS